MLAISFALVIITYTSHAAIHTRGNKGCKYHVDVLWTHEVSHSTFAAAPLITDVDADGTLDIVAVTFQEEVTVLHGENGKLLAGSKWPQKLLESSVHSSPLQYDIDRDGKLDIVIVTSNGELQFYQSDGKKLDANQFQLPGLQVQKDWFNKTLSAAKYDVHDYISDITPKENKPMEGYVVVDPHVLATPVIVDFNRDKIIEEMVIPVSYYFDVEDYSFQKKLEENKLNINYTELDNYLVSGLVLLNLTNMNIIRTIHLELTKTSSEYPGYILFPPTMIDMDANGSPLEMIVVTSAGNLHVLDIEGNNREGFPIPTDTLHGQPIVADVNLDGNLEIVVFDVSGNVMCYNMNGKVVWESQLSAGTSTSGGKIADIDLDGVMDIVAASSDGELWALRGDTGAVHDGWPFKYGRSLTAVPLVTKLANESDVDIVLLSDDDHIHIYAGDGKCRHTVNLGEHTLVSILSHELVPEAPGLEMLVATKDGTLLCLGNKNLDEDLVPDYRKAVLDGWHSEPRSHNDFMYGNSKVGIVLSDEFDSLLDYTGTWFTVTFDILDLEKSKRNYEVLVYYGNALLGSEKYTSPGTYSISVPCPEGPTHGHVTIMMLNSYGQMYKDTIAVRFNMTFLHDLPWLLVCPFVAMGVILLILHGYPAVNLLPTTATEKGS